MRGLRKIGAGVLLTAALLTIGSCDFDAAKEAFDAFDVIVELEPINTVVAGLIVDANGNDLVEVDVTLRFAGTDAGAVIDMFSDPIQQQHVEGGLTSFGIQNSRVPSVNDPVILRVLAEAEGYMPGSATLQLDDVGQHQFTDLTDDTSQAS